MAGAKSVVRLIWSKRGMSRNWVTRAMNSIPAAKPIASFPLLVPNRVTPNTVSPSINCTQPQAENNKRLASEIW